MELFTGMVPDFILYSVEVKTTAIVIAVSSSLCCSFVWLLMSIINHVYQLDESKSAVLDTVPRTEIKAKSSLYGRRNSLPVNRSITKDVCIGRQNSFCSALPVKPRWTCTTYVICSIPCSKCSLSNADKICPDMLCKTCCRANIKTVCQFHREKLKSSFKNINSYKKPQQVDLSHLNLIQCPDRVGFMGSQLSSLDLSYNFLHSLPVEIGCLLGLQQLYLQHNHLSQLPVIIGNLIQLRELNLDHNKLRDLPASMGDLRQMRILSVCHNRLTQVPGDLGKLVHLLELRLGDNKIETIPNKMCSLPKLKHLQLKKNILSSLPDRIFEMVRLSELDVSHNDLGVLPCNITKCAFMTRIKCTNNRLKHLPSHLHRLQHLKYLNVCSNQLSYFPASLHGLDLHVLGVDDNPLWREGRVKTGGRTCGTRGVVPQTLTEQCVLYIAATGLRWRKQDLPLVLEETLESVDHCTCCEGPLLQTCRSRLEFYTLTTSQRVPLYQKICLPRGGKHCKFMELVTINS